MAAPLLVAAIGGALINIAGTVAGRVMVALGFGLVTYTGISTSMAYLKDQAIQNFTALPAGVLGMLATMKVGESISIIFSAILARMLLNGLTGDTIKRLVQR